MVSIAEDEYDDLLQEKAFSDGLNVIIDKLLERMNEINNACFDYQNADEEPTKETAWNTIKNIYDLSLMPEQK